jgi:Mg2+/Co2+ transporter CorB
MAASRAKLHAMEKNGSRRAKQVRHLVLKPDKVLSTVLLGNTLVNSASSAIVTSILLAMFGEAGIAYATIAVTVLVLIFAEVLPKTLAAISPERIAVAIYLPMQAMVWLFKPITKMIRWLVKLIFSLTGLSDKFTSPFSVDDLRGAIGLGHEQGLLAETERHMLESVLELDKLTVKDLMQHRSKITGISINANPADIYSIVVDSSYSRFPVWEGDRENIVGTFHAKDFYAAYTAHLMGQDFDLHDFMQEPYFIPTTTLATNQLLEFRANRKHLGLVVDEYGDMQGMITLEDILEEIVGEIEDEHDLAHPTIQTEADGSVIFTATTTIRQANKLMGWHLPDDDHVSLGGLVAAKAKGIPPEGTKVTVGSIVFEVIAKRRNAILKLRALPRAKVAKK